MIDGRTQSVSQKRNVRRPEKSEAGSRMVSRHGVANARARVIGALLAHEGVGVDGEGADDRHGRASRVRPTRLHHRQRGLDRRLGQELVGEVTADPDILLTTGHDPDGRDPGGADLEAVDPLALVLARADHERVHGGRPHVVPYHDVTGADGLLRGDARHADTQTELPDLRILELRHEDPHPETDVVPDRKRPDRSDRGEDDVQVALLLVERQTGASVAQEALLALRVDVAPADGRPGTDATVVPTLTRRRIRIGDALAHEALCGEVRAHQLRVVVEKTWRAHVRVRSTRTVHQHVIDGARVFVVADRLTDASHTAVRRHVDVETDANRIAVGVADATTTTSELADAVGVVAVGLAVQVVIDAVEAVLDHFIRLDRDTVPAGVAERQKRQKRRERDQAQTDLSVSH
ncbi:hypothetical protein C0581_04200 [Candidatus Parcubacteria bacterium]|nr:MAG: hypothetical protein C0581_04200 [Candidatus Parcubacteria bacterium]